MRNIKEWLGDAPFYKKLFNIALPIAFQNLLMNSLHLVDILMIGQLKNEAAIPGVGQAGQVVFVLNLLFFGASSGASIFASQFWGKKDIGGIRKVMGLNLSITLLMALLFSFGTFFMPSTILSWLAKDRAVIQTGAEYLRIVGISFFFIAITFPFSILLRSIERARLPMSITLFSLSLNTLLNYLLIFGHLGFPAMGIKGAALATVISRILECLVLLSILYTKKNALAGSLKEFFSFNLLFITRFFKSAFPVILNELGWVLAMTMFKVVYGQMGMAEITAITITETISNLFFTLFIGSGNACSVLLGIQIGAGDLRGAFRDAKRFMLLGPLAGAFLGGLMALSALFTPGFFHVTALSKSYAFWLLVAGGLLLPFRVFNMHVFVGILRSGGDTLYALIMELVILWGVAVPLAALGGLVLRLPVYLVFLLAGSEEPIKAVIAFGRVMSKRWLKDVTE